MGPADAVECTLLFIIVLLFRGSGFSDFLSEQAPGSQVLETAALLQSTQPALFHASTTRSTDAACSSDD